MPYSLIFQWSVYCLQSVKLLRQDKTEVGGGGVVWFPRRIEGRAAELL